MLTSRAADPTIRGRATGQFPRNIQKHVQFLVQLNVSAECGLACQVHEVIICGFVENHGNPMLFTLQIRAMLTKKMPCVEICR